MSDKLNSNEDLINVGSITSQDGRFTFVMQGDGNLVLYGSGGNARWATNTDGRIISQAIMQGDGNFVMYGPGGTYIWDTATDGHSGAYLTVQNDGNVVIYDTAGNPLWATNTNIIHCMVPGFLPSKSGLHFTNSFPSGIPLLYINVMGAQIPIGDASNGLCGGMGYTVRDYFEAGLTPPADTTPPTSGLLFDFLVRRLFDSFNLPLGPTKYIHLMDPALPDHETSFSDAGLAPHGRAWVMINEEWPKIRSDIDSGRLSPIGLVSIKSLDPFKMGENHQVLAYGYELDNTNLTIWVYDPNFKDNNNITISLSVANPRQSTSVGYSGTIYGGDQKIWCFFRPDYSFVNPPSIAPPIGIGDHFYTESVIERDNAIARFGYQSEDIACYVLSTPTRARKPLYRLLNPGTGDHFYTISKEESDSAVINSGYQMEGIACYVFASPTRATTAFYRLYNPVNGDHFYTISVNERDNAIASFGYQDEGIACYVYRSKAKGRTQLYRLLKIA